LPRPADFRFENQQAKAMENLAVRNLNTASHKTEFQSALQPENFLSSIDRKER
jgi:hypothetical protein